MAKVVIASKLLALISNTISNDQGASFRQALETIIPKMDDAYRGHDDPFRSHLGASLIGKKCKRELAYGFKWTKIPSFESRILRLFNRGHLEEARFIAMLIAAGIDVWYETEDGGQFRVIDIEGHFGSALDGIVRGVPDMPLVPMYAEFKTHNDKSFKSLVNNGVEKGKNQHFIQTQMCMYSYKLEYALYMAVNKNDDTLYAEIIKYDPKIAEWYLKSAREIIYNDTLPERISESPGWYECKFCDFRVNCHSLVIPEINCRTCSHSKPLDTGGASWKCKLFKEPIDKTRQMKGCLSHLINPALLSGTIAVSGSIPNNTVTIEYKGKQVEYGYDLIPLMELINET